jgi:hypothetical protein
MKLNFYTIVWLCCAISVGAQSTFLVDQEITTPPRVSARPLGNFTEPFGQSFTPSSGLIDTVYFNFYDSSRNSASSISVNLRASSITGTIIGTTLYQPITAGHDGIGAFYFAQPVVLIPGITYYLQLVSATDRLYAFYDTGGGYAGGNFYTQGTATGNDLWFREGITIVPEPSALWLSVAGAGGMVFWRKRFGGKS